MQVTRAALKRVVATRHRHDLVLARADMRDWVMQRRARTCQLIELGGLVVKAGIVELIEDDRATLYGALLEVAATLRGERREQALALWRRRGRRAFEADTNREA